MATQVQNRRQVEFPTHETPHTDINTLQMFLIAAAFTVVWFVLLYLTPVTKSNFIRDLFLGSDIQEGVVVHGYLPERLIFQGTITFVWALSMANVILKILLINKERASLDESVVPDGLDLTDTDRLI